MMIRCSCWIAVSHTTSVNLSSPSSSRGLSDPKHNPLGKRFLILDSSLEILKILDVSFERYNNNNNNKLSRLVVKMNYSWILFTNVASPFQVQGIAVAVEKKLGLSTSC